MKVAAIPSSKLRGRAPSPAWLFEADVFGTTADPIKAAVRKQGMRCEVTRQDLLARGLAADRLARGDCVIACGSFPFVHHVQSQHGWRPGAFCTTENFACSTYYPHFGEEILNAKHEILTGMAAIARADELFDRFASDGQVFIRPDGCEKTFTGRVVSREEFAAALGPARYNPQTRIVVAPPRPDPIFMLDVCDRLFVVEIGPFSTCGFYDCDPSAVVSAAREIASAAWLTSASGAG